MLKEIKEAQERNKILDILNRCDKIALERTQDIDLMVDILNGSIYEQAKRDFEIDKSLGLYDNMNMRKEFNK